MHTCTVESPLLSRDCAGVSPALSSSLSSISTMPAVRFLVDRKRGLSSGVNGVLESREGEGEGRRCFERVETFEEARLLLGSAELVSDSPV